MTAAILIALIAIMTTAGVFATRHEEDAPPQGRKAWMLTTAYWLLTLPVAFEMAAGGLWDLLRIEYVRVVLTHLGYPWLEQFQKAAARPDATPAKPA